VPGSRRRAPSARSAPAALWEDLRDGRVQTIGSDHSPAPAELKTSPDFFAIWGGIGGVQHGAQLLLSECADTAARDFPRLAALLAANVARRFHLPTKGLIEPGKDADFCVLEIEEPRAIEAEELWTRHRISPYVGRPNRVRVTDTVVRGRAVFAGGRHVNFAPPGHFLRPGR